ncbi:DNA-binding GntR family transcriptional regulator [Tepidamorphus gemmatus]|uniref:DNA-binding GntR family transcriptional regulator n=1 Tax=Tepidamorphus gemmatus TaxID=747076 RepID=A0A4R3M2R4_9HYPH|nr:GntR family transcriptional regulator [Tepidamorphus gemmatus]TCT05435.1 DNA-binding GntR family transcriptional regulator [Tepidamorphus gemmatus]
MSVRAAEQRIEEGSQRARAYHEIRRRILANELQPGVQMLETEVADLLGMSRTPVREALIRLAEEGLVEVRPRHGMRVKPVSPQDMREIYDVLTSLEATAAALAARRPLSGEELAGLEAAVAEMDEALECDDLKRWAEADQRFHDLLVIGSGNRRLQDIVGTLRDQAHRVRMATLALRPKPVESNNDHRAVVEAIRRGDAEAAWRAHHDHRSRSGRMLVDLLTRLGVGGI